MGESARGVIATYSLLSKSERLPKEFARPGIDEIALILKAVDLASTMFERKKVSNSSRRHRRYPQKEQIEN